MKYDIVQAEKVYITVSADLVLENGYNLTETSTAIDDVLTSYIQSLRIGESVIWSEVHYIIMTVSGVKSVKNLKLYYKRLTDSEFTENSVYEDIDIDEQEIGNYVGSNFDIYGGE